MVTTEVHIGHIAVGSGLETLSASGVGSCLVITLYDPRLRIGALVHAMLPDSSRVAKHTPQDARHVDTAIEQMVKELEDLGARTGHLEAKIVGGANMFGEFDMDVGSENIDSARKKLKEKRIKLVAECVGGHNGRSVEFCAGSGVVTSKISL